MDMESDQITSNNNTIKDLIKDYTKKNMHGKIKKKKPNVWRKEAMWGIEPEFEIDK